MRIEQLTVILLVFAIPLILDIQVKFIPDWQVPIFGILTIIGSGSLAVILKKWRHPELNNTSSESST